MPPKFTFFSGDLPPASLAADFGEELAKQHSQDFLGHFFQATKYGMKVKLNVEYCPGRALSEHGLAPFKYDLLEITGARENWKQLMGTVYTLHQNMDLNEIDAELEAAVKKLGKAAKRSREEREEDDLLERLQQQVNDVKAKKLQRLSNAASQNDASDHS